ncbi:MAG: peroxiredoxin [Spirochaetes bacterium]|nr:peroxiredoxin [Spirochaetota bacterium]
MGCGGSHGGDVLKDQHGKTVRLSDFRGRRLLVYFYPKADTPGCTKQSCSVRDARPDLASLGVDVVGISADTDHAVCEAWGVWGDKSMYGKVYQGITRSSFLVGEDGRLRAAWYKVKPEETVPKAREALAGR